MDIEIHCEVCGTTYSAIGIDPAVNQGIMMVWKDQHTHTPQELKLYHDSELEVQKYYRGLGE